VTAVFASSDQQQNKTASGRSPNVGDNTNIGERSFFHFRFLETFNYQSPFGRWPLLRLLTNNEPPFCTKGRTLFLTNTKTASGRSLNVGDSTNIGERSFF